MRETVRSITLYLTIVGILGSATQLGVVLDPESVVLDRLVSLLGVGVTVAYVVAGVGFRKYVAARSLFPQRVLIVGIAYSLAVSLLILVLHAISGTPLSSNPEGVSQIGRSVFGLLITLYLLRNVRRLVSESSAPVAT